MTKARDIADFKFEDIVDTGTEGTKVASGTTAERGSTAGQIRFNSTTGLAEYYNGSIFKSIDAPPTVSSLDVTEVDSQAGGNQTIVITGDNFQSGATVTFVGASGTNFNASTVTVDSATQITAVAPKSSFLNAQEPYGVKVENTSGLSNTLASQINVDTSPSWQTASGSLGIINENATGNHFTVSATDADSDTVAYSLQSGSLGGLSLNSSTGVISGDPTDVSSDTTNSFTLRATANGKTADRAFSFITQNVTTGIFDIFGDSSALSLHQLNNSYNQTGSGTGNLANSGVSFNSTSKFGSHSLNTLGNGNYIDITNTTRIYAISAWVYMPTGSGGDDEYIFEFRHDNPSNGRGYMYTYLSSQSGKIQYIDLSNDTTANNRIGNIYIDGTQITSGQFHFSTNTWHHIVCSVNNASEARQTWNEGVRFGNRADGSSGGNFGYIDQIRTFNRALSSSEVTTLYNEVE